MPVTKAQRIGIKIETFTLLANQIIIKFFLPTKKNANVHNSCVKVLIHVCWRQNIMKSLSYLSLKDYSRGFQSYRKVLHDKSLAIFWLF